MAQTMSLSDWQALKPAGLETPVAQYNAWEGDAPSLPGQAQQVVLALFSRAHCSRSRQMGLTPMAPRGRRLRRRPLASCRGKKPLLAIFFAPIEILRTGD